MRGGWKQAGKGVGHKGVVEGGGRGGVKTSRVGRETNSVQTDRQNDRQTDRTTDRPTDIKW